VLAAVHEDTALVSVQLANHEVGTVQPVAEITAGLRERGVLVHVDACAAAGHMPVDFRALDVDLCSVTAHKLGGPKGAGALLVRRGLRIDPLLVGGAQERARRAGIEDVPAWVGFGAACAACDVSAEEAAQRSLVGAAARVVSSVPGVTRFGAADTDASLPNILCMGVDGVEAEPILLALDQHGVAVHSGSSCSSETLEPSPVLAAMGVDADHSLRISVGWSSTPADVAGFVEVFPGIVERLRGLRAP
jgi:cysteine desulfurase